MIAKETTGTNSSSPNGSAKLRQKTPPRQGFGAALSMFLYRILRFLSRSFLRVLYPGNTAEGLENALIEGPFIIAGNHPNTLIDPLIQGIHLEKRLHFMANAGLFGNTWMAKFLLFAGVIPIARRGVDGEAGRKVDNNESFEAAYAHFEHGGILFVAPEGGSELERRLRQPLKPGTARMAFAAEERNNWQLGLRVVPTAGNYEAPTRCFTRAFVRYGSPIAVADWQTAYQENPREAVRDFTQHLGQRMAELLIDTRNKTEERCLRPIERAIQNDTPLTVQDHHARTQAILSHLRTLDEASFEKLSQYAKNYERLLKKAKIDDVVLSSHPAKKPSLGHFLGLPFFLYGWLNHLPLIGLTELAWKSIKTYRNYAATVRGLVGTILLPIFYAFQTWLLSLLLGPWAWLYLLSLPLAGFFALGYYTRYRPFWAALLGRKKASKEMAVLRLRLLKAVAKVE